MITKLFVSLIGLGFMSGVNANALELLVEKHGKSAVVAAIGEKTGNQFTVQDASGIKRLSRPRLNVLTIGTLNFDLKRTGLTTAELDRLITKRRAESVINRKQLKKDKKRLDELKKYNARRLTQELETNLKIEHLSKTPPLLYRATIEEYMNNNLFDPYSVKDLRIAQPKDKYFTKPMFGYSPGSIFYSVYVSYNAKNKFGDYVGKNRFYYYFRGEKLIEVENIN